MPVTVCVLNLPASRDYRVFIFCFKQECDVFRGIVIHVTVESLMKTVGIMKPSPHPELSWTHTSKVEETNEPMLIEK